MASAQHTTFSERRLGVLKDYLILTKPRIILNNLITAFGGFWLASHWTIDWVLLLFMLAGTGFIMASACVLNNYIDREEDQKMDRTRHRPLPSGRVDPANALIFSFVLGVLGVLVLLQTNLLTLFLALLGFLVYVLIYTIWLKRTSAWCTSVGGISGAMPPVIGYCSVTGAVDAGAILLFTFMFLWQPPHFWALGIRRLEEYRKAGFPMLPVVKGIRRTKLQMLPYVALLLPTGFLFYYLGYTGMIFFAVSLVTGLVWLGICLSGFMRENDHAWANEAFYFSLFYLSVNFVAMILDTRAGPSI